jgi:Sec-independent protein translocase protein TatA
MAGQCCDINDFTTPEACAAQPTDTYTGFCARGTTISNKLLREFLMPADTTYCPGADK